MPLALYMLRSMLRASSRTLPSTLLMRLAEVRSSAAPRVWMVRGGCSSTCLGTCTPRLACAAVRAIWAKLAAELGAKRYLDR